MRFNALLVAGLLPWLWAADARAQAQERVLSLRPAASAPQPQMAPLTFAPPAVALARIDADTRLLAWLPSQVEVRKGSGLAVSHPLRMGGADIELGVSGPVVHRRNLGLAVEIRF